MTMPIAAPIHTYALECLICGATPDQVPDLHHGSDLNNLQAHVRNSGPKPWACVASEGQSRPHNVSPD